MGDNNNLVVTKIPVDQVFPHPQNPRKELGDLTELTESIRKNGIMQNLTVFPQNKDMDRFTVLIGHRRLAAAKAAGMSTVPCRILLTPPDMREQMAIMLEENMQRNDLTVPEQAQGFQMMLDLGFSEEEIATKTGFSKATICRRLNIAKLDQKLLAKKMTDYQMNLTDLYELERVPDPAQRDEILRGTSSSAQIKWAVDQWIEKDAKQKWREKLIDYLVKHGVKQIIGEAKDHPERYERKMVGAISRKDEQMKLPKHDGDIWYEISEWECVARLYELKKIPDSQRLKEKNEREREQAARDLIERIWAELKASMVDFAKWLSLNAGIRELKDDAETMALIREAMRGYSFTWKRIIAMLNDASEYNLSDEDIEKGIEDLGKKPMKLLAVCALVQQATCQQLVDYHGHYSGKGSMILKTVELLEGYGFTVTVEQRAAVDGTHDAYIGG